MTSLSWAQWCAHRSQPVQPANASAAEASGSRALSAASETFAFHDPCALARELRETIAPRALLAAAVSDVREPARCGVDTSCCGASGLLPRTMPDIAQRIAEDRRAELGGPAVTSSPACAAALGASEVVSVLARWLAQGTR